MNKWMFRVGVVIAFLLLGAVPSQAQNAQITGVVSDASGGVIPGATVTARNQDTGLVRTVVTDHLGGYRLQALPPGYTSSPPSWPASQRRLVPIFSWSSTRPPLWTSP